MRTVTPLLLALLVAFAAPASAQTDYSRFSADDLEDGGRLPDAQPVCLVWDGGNLLFFDDTSDQIVQFDPDEPAGSRVSILFSSADLSTLTGVDVTACRDADARVFRAVFALSNADNVDFVFSFLTSGANPFVPTAEPAVDGITGIAIAGIGPGMDVAYVTRSQFFGAPEDGVYEVPLRFGFINEVTALVTDPDLDLVGIDVSSNGDIYATTSENGSGDFVNKVVRVAFPQTSPSLQVLFDPFAGDDAVFVNGTDGGLEDLQIAVQDGEQRLFIMNNSFGGPQGETIARFNLDGSVPVVAFTEAALIADGDAGAETGSAFTTAGGSGYFTLSTTFGANPVVQSLFVASRASNGGQTAIFEADISDLRVSAEQEAEATGYALALANPASGSVRVQLTQPHTADVRVSVVDVLGREVAVLADGVRSGGTSEMTLDASALSPGTYVLRLVADGYRTARTITVVR